MFLGSWSLILLDPSELQKLPTRECIRNMFLRWFPFPIDGGLPMMGMLSVLHSGSTWADGKQTPVLHQCYSIK